MTSLWIVVAVVGGSAGLWVVLEWLKDVGSVDSSVPSTHLQRTARVSLLASALLAAGAVGVVLFFGPTRVFEDPGLRIPTSILMIVTLAVLGLGVLRLRMRARDQRSLLDEVDEAILARAPSFQSIGTILALALWTVGLYESFAEQGQVPLHFLILVFWSCLVANLMGLPVGILAGYRRQGNA